VSLAQAQAAVGAEIAYYRAHTRRGPRSGRAGLASGARCAEVLVEALPRGVRELVPAGDGVVELLLASLRFGPSPTRSVRCRGCVSAGALLVVVSNWDVSLHEVLERIGLAPYLDGVVTSAEVGARKPDPAIFERRWGLRASPRPSRSTSATRSRRTSRGRRTLGSSRC